MVRDTIEEINFYRLLLSCEHKLKQQPIDVWDPSEKRKLATYVKHLTTLEKKIQPSHIKSLTDRMKHLNTAVSEHTMHMDVEKGTIEARLVKKKHLEELKQYERPDPEWLIDLKQQQETLEKVEEKKNLLEQEGMKEQDSPTSVIKEKEQANNELRLRNTHKEKNAEMETTANIEHVLQHHRQIHDELTTDLSKMAEQLKLNSQAFGERLSKDDEILREASRAVENNLDRMRTEKERLDVHYSKSWSTSFMTLGVVLFVCIMFILVFFTIRFLPKAS
ncbi:vesicle transport protein [Cokeromyces recurvatus]|uniref:vesicle transport protein n=1 Tax=Cokeromyces recurvatus TaxID=90255 RepID=UPI00221F64B1|nr:vesicle transport protein [Cokeromyces recurvatus]KAI7902911.1 vesicle transport protein [Cokeromyces recurvatus]